MAWLGSLLISGWESFKYGVLMGFCSRCGLGWPWLHRDQAGAVQVEERMGQVQGHLRQWLVRREQHPQDKVWGQVAGKGWCHRQAMLLECGEGLRVRGTFGALGLEQSIWGSRAMGDKTPPKHQNLSQAESVLRERWLGSECRGRLSWWEDPSDSLPR